MDFIKIKKKVEKENADRINIINTKFRTCLCLFNNYSKCYINIKKKYFMDTCRYDKIYGFENIKINDENKNEINKESSLEYPYPYKYENNRNIFLIINTKNVNSNNTCIYNNDIIYIIYNNKKYEHINIQKKPNKKHKYTKKRNGHIHDQVLTNQEKSTSELSNDRNSVFSSSENNEEIEDNENEQNPLYNSTIFETRNMNFSETIEKKSKKKKILSSKSNKRNLIYSDIDSDNNYENVFTHINSNLYFLSVSNKHIENEQNLYIQNEKYINNNDIIFRKLKFTKSLFINLDTYNSWIIIKKNILLNEYINRSKKNDIVDINDVLYDITNSYAKIKNCHTRLYINDGFLLINNKTKEILGVRKINNSTSKINYNSNLDTNYNTQKNKHIHNDGIHNGEKNVFDIKNKIIDESETYKLVLIKKMNLNHLFCMSTDINIVFNFHDVCLKSYNKIDMANNYLLANHTLNIHNIHLEYNKENTTNLNLSDPDYIYFNNYITQKIVENYNSYNLYIKESLLIIDILYILNNSYGNLIYIKEYYKYDHQNYYSDIILTLKKNKNIFNDPHTITTTNNNSLEPHKDIKEYDEKKTKKMQKSKKKHSNTSIYSISSYSDSDEYNESNQPSSAFSDFSNSKYTYSQMGSSNKNKFQDLNNYLVYIIPKYKIVIYPSIYNPKDNNNSNIKMVKEILKLGIYIRKIQKFIEINKRSQSCNATFEIFSCCLNNITLHIINHINRIEKNIRNIYNFTKINMQGKEEIALSLFDENKMSFSANNEQQNLFFTINSLFNKNVKDFNIFFNINIEKADDISLYKIKLCILPLMQIAKLLNKIINKIAIKKKFNDTKYLIDLIYKLQEYLNKDDINKTVLTYLLKNITIPLFDFIKNYIFHGKVKDTFKEFFIHENKHITPFYKQNNKIYYINHNFYKYIFKKYIDLSTNYWGAKYVILNSKVPKFLKSIANQIFITGKYIDVLFTCSTLFNYNTPLFLDLNYSENNYNDSSCSYIPGKLLLLNYEDPTSNNKSKQNNQISTYTGNIIKYEQPQNKVGDEFSTVEPYITYKKQRKTNPTGLGINQLENRFRKENNYYDIQNKFNHQFLIDQTNNKECFLLYDSEQKTYEELIHNQHLYASKKMFELYIKNIDIKEKIRHHFFFYFLQISDYLKYFYILSHDHLEKLYNHKKNNILTKIKNFFDISLRSSVLDNLKYRKDYSIHVSDILNITDNINLIIDLKKFCKFNKSTRNNIGDNDDTHRKKNNNIEDSSDNSDENDNKNNHNFDNNFHSRTQINERTKSPINIQTNVNVEIYKGLILSYHNVFPYNLIFNNITIFKYTLIFRILNYCKYIEHKLTEVWINHMYIKNVDMTNECKNNLMLCIHTRESMIHFIKCYIYHIQNDVIKSEYMSMNEKLKDTFIFDDIIYIHNNYLNNIFKYSFIINQNIINSILKIISIAHIFTRHILKFSFNKNDPASDITRCRPERVQNNSINKDLSNQKNFNTNNKTDKNNYQKKFINELLRDKAYISMIHNTIKHYDKHFKNFFFLLTEYVNNNIDDYAHNFLIKLDYNFYYTNKYKQSFQTNSSNYHAKDNTEWAPNQSQDQHQSKNYLLQNQNHISINTTNNEHIGKINSSDYHYGNNTHIHRPHKDASINEIPEQVRNYNNYINNNNALPIIPDISPISNHMANVPMYTANDDISPLTGYPSNRYNKNNETNLKYELNRNNFTNINRDSNNTYSQIHIQENNYNKSKLIDNNILNENNYTTLYAKNNLQNIPINHDNYEHAISNLSPNNINYAKLKKHAPYNNNNNNNKQINSINVSNIDLNSIDNSMNNSRMFNI
ncbi:spindle pole body protein, putative [Plasmodium berghei]|uniref:Spindle pole body protein, putative n=2 Tax=Plasmodium berghei TaxID=5821 RepID=A0A509ADS7_PLABA|nr:spindle pole body protein, putative [Plasmodium berghei ANKA]CXH99215.1 spindle pole body protein, putative [Plasmodium berghei]SCL91497.1 spindle pole body protein, putative [Plasmodium berghei]SCM15480.1 spindle pole body protein, putative [Plasmodium berghei]SCM17272.1 spindle pole body protein, putative [Plasmodium berghei]SCN22426.1 spindle pole body protein, putative [Plasmodium berghei]|eukprot:XP_034420078.1 spindle pole body protein, putative [Plasmodium berghei ANKA]